MENDIQSAWLFRSGSFLGFPASLDPHRCCSYCTALISHVWTYRRDESESPVAPSSLLPRSIVEPLVQLVCYKLEDWDKDDEQRDVTKLVEVRFYRYTHPGSGRSRT